MDLTENNVGSNIKFFRERYGLTQESVAKYLNTKREIISYYETGDRTPPVKHLQSLANLFGVELIELLEKEPAYAMANVAFAFRTNELPSSDLKGIANFRKIVKNYLKLKQINQK